MAKTPSQIAEFYPIGGEHTINKTNKNEIIISLLFQKKDLTSNVNKIEWFRGASKEMAELMDEVSEINSKLTINKKISVEIQFNENGGGEWFVDLKSVKARIDAFKKSKSKGSKKKTKTKTATLTQ